jgi:hypothetical protein
MTIPVWQYNNQHDGMYGRPAIVDVKEKSPTVVPDFLLDQNFPNPFNPTTKIKYTIPAGTHGRASLLVYDLLGRQVATLVNEAQAPGLYEVTWDATRFGSGMYYYRLSAGGVTSTKKMLLMK